MLLAELRQQGPHVAGGRHPKTVPKILCRPNSPITRISGRILGHVGTVIQETPTALTEIDEPRARALDRAARAPRHRI